MHELTKYIMTADAIHKKMGELYTFRCVDFSSRVRLHGVSFK